MGFVLSARRRVKSVARAFLFRAGTQAYPNRVYIFSRSAHNVADALKQAQAHDLILPRHFGASFAGRAPINR